MNDKLFLINVGIMEEDENINDDDDQEAKPIKVHYDFFNNLNNNYSPFAHLLKGSSYRIPNSSRYKTSRGNIKFVLLTSIESDHRDFSFDQPSKDRLEFGSQMKKTDNDTARRKEIYDQSKRYDFCFSLNSRHITSKRF